MVSVVGEDPTTYVPVPPSELVHRLRESYAQDLNLLDDHLPSITAKDPLPMLNLWGYEKIIERAVAMIEGARVSLFMVLWREDQPRVEAALHRAHDRGVPIYIVGFDRPDLEVGVLVHHGAEESVIEDMQGRSFYLTADNEGLVGMITTAEDSQGAWTRHPGLAMIIRELVIHDLYLNEIMQTYGADFVVKFGEAGELLRDKYRYVKGRTPATLPRGAERGSW